MLEENLDMCNTLKKYFEGNIICYFFISKKKKRFCVNVDKMLFKKGTEYLYCSLKEAHFYCNIFSFLFCKLQSATQQTMTECF